MPKLRHRVSDGWYFIRTFTHSGDVGHNGTWQIHAAGMDVLREERIIHDDADIPPRLFRYLRDARLIYTETGELRLPPRRPPEPPPASSPVRRRQPQRPAPAFHFPPIVRFVFNDDLSWHISASLDHLCQPHWTEQIEPLRQLIDETTNGRICVGDGTMLVKDLDPGTPFGGCTTPVGLSTDQYVARLRGKGADGSSRSVQIGYTRGLCARGTLFSFHGRRLGSNEPTAWGESYYVVLQTLYTDPNPLLDACRPIRLVRRIPWSAYRIRLPESPDPRVQAYLTGIGHTPHDTEEPED